MKKNTVLDPEQVKAVFIDCLFQDGEDTTDHIGIKGITKDVWFHSKRLQSHKAEIEVMLGELPDEFKKSGGGWSFLKADKDRHGHQWTMLHQRVEQLFMLGMGIGKVQYQMPKEVWPALPGGMPYYIIN
ncbi:MAG TPA: hypothetical protein DEB09_05170 [Candidatus Magasanikbacteria bacterium]|nr:hypothetical protein [Candidatus Magasanikbacteria bacterium]